MSFSKKADIPEENKQKKCAAGSKLEFDCQTTDYVEFSMDSSDDEMWQATSAKNEASDWAAKRPRNLLSSLTGIRLHGIFSRSQPPPQHTYTSQWAKDSAMTAGDTDVQSVASNDCGLETEAQAQKLDQRASDHQESSGSTDENFTDLSGEEELIEIRERFQRETQAVLELLDQAQAAGGSVQIENSNLVLEQQIREHIREIDAIFGNERQNLTDIIALGDTRICELVRDSKTAWKERTSLKTTIEALSSLIEEKEKSCILQTRKLEDLEEDSLRLHQAKATVENRERRIKKLEVDFETAQVAHKFEVDKLQATMKELEESHNTAVARVNREFEEMVARQREILEEKEAEINELMQQICDAKHDKDEQDDLNCEQIRKLQAEHESAYLELAQRYDKLAEENLKQAGAHYAVVSDLKEQLEQAIKFARQEPEKAVELAKQAVADEKDSKLKALTVQAQEKDDEIEALKISHKEKDDKISALKMQIEESSADQALEIALNSEEVPANTCQAGTRQDTEVLQQQIRIQADHIDKLNSTEAAFENTIKELRQTCW